MIRYTLRCEREHGFDGWFRSSEDYDGQEARGLLACPVCGSASVTKALMAPALRTAEKAGEGAPTSADGVPMSADEGRSVQTAEIALLGEKETRLRAMLRAVRAEVTKNAVDVGPRFADVARQMHEGEIERASVYGRASSEEVRALAEDGIEFHPLPSLADDAN